MNLDTRIFLDINDFARNTPWLHPIMSGYANYGVALFAGLLLAGWWVARRQASVEHMVAAVWAPIGALAALAINQPISGAVNETRPCIALHEIVVLHCNNDGSFPSDHAIMAGAVATGLVLGAVVSLAGFWLARPALGWLLTQIARTPLQNLVTAPAQSTAAQGNSR
ncbi:UDP-diphosphatase [Nocardia sp. NPDC051052]|uniref:UDP-diphosphatase n=1 Tax=Nocardia sp. NPDC051052 TaxID=3364322 RepID=UPI0037986552